MLATHTLINFDPSADTFVLLPVISLGQTRSSRIVSWTAVRVRDRGRFCLWAVEEFRFGLGRTRRWEMKTIYLSESFFSSSRVSLARRARQHQAQVMAPVCLPKDSPNVSISNEQLAGRLLCASQNDYLV